jgi:hypothetical protein
MNGAYLMARIGSRAMLQRTQQLSRALPEREVAGYFPRLSQPSVLLLGSYRVSGKDGGTVQPLFATKNPRWRTVMRLAARVTNNAKILEEVIFDNERKGDIKRAVAKLARRFRKGKLGSNFFADGTSISVVNAD